MRAARRQPEATSSPFPGRRRAVCAPGFTLVELLVVLVLGCGLLGGLIALTQTTAQASRGVGENLRSLQMSIDALAAVRRDLARCQVVRVATDGSSITYSLPVPAGTAGAFINDAGEVYWGVADSDGVHLDGTITLAFVRTSTVREADEGADMNGDGDRLDSFELGRLTRTTSTGENLGVPRIDLLLRTGDLGGDVDGDGTRDPLFSVDGAHREVSLRVARFAREGRLRIFPVRSGVADLDPSLR